MEGRYDELASARWLAPDLEPEFGYLARGDRDLDEDGLYDIVVGSPTVYEGETDIIQVLPGFAFPFDDPTRW